MIRLIFVGDIISFFIFIMGLIPVLILSYGSYPIIRSWSDKKSDFVISKEGIKIKKTFLEWKQIKSISLNTNRMKSKIPYYMKNFSLPTLQEIYILDKKGKEYFTNIDIDYSFKKNRITNNYVKIRDVLIDMDKIVLMSDWAQKR
ncbi:hypothetical protein HN827_00480 [archaeon]|jgi:hypothetical protein|nr:hypothetical protein [archaeon]MBT7391274.1 hypothetical protein [archaeon]